MILIINDRLLTQYIKSNFKKYFFKHCFKINSILAKKNNYEKNYTSFIYRILHYIM